MVAEQCGVDNRRTVSGVELEDERQRAARATEYVVKAGAGLPEGHDGILVETDEDLISLDGAGELMVLYSKMKGDYYRYAERVAATPESQIMEEIMEVIRLVPEERMHERIVEETIDVPVSCVMEETIEELVTTRDTNKLLNDCELIPKWFNVVKNVVVSEDLPLNVYRETLLQNKILRVIKKNHVTKCREKLAEIAEQNDDYKMFYKQIGRRLKLGIHEDSTVGVKTAEVLRFNMSKPGHEQFSFDGYVDHMKEGQKRHLLHHRRGHRCRVLLVRGKSAQEGP